MQSSWNVNEINRPYNNNNHVNYLASLGNCGVFVTGHISHLATKNHTRWDLCEATTIPYHTLLVPSYNPISSNAPLPTMVLFMLYMKAELENVDSVTLRKDINLCINVRNPLENSEVREKVVMNPSEFLEQDESSREPHHHFALRWEGNKKASVLIVLDEAGVKTALKKKKKVKAPGDYTSDDAGEWSPILAVECRGLEPEGFFPMGNDFVVASSGGAVFGEDVDFGEGDWAEYDESNDEPVSMSDIEFKWESV